jgi:hypothetical protein
VHVSVDRNVRLTSRQIFFQVPVNLAKNIGSLAIRNE